MDVCVLKIQKYFPSVPKNVLLKIYKARCERLRLLMKNGIPNDIRWIIEAKIRLGGEIIGSIKDPIIPYMPGFGKSSYTKKRRAKRLEVCFKCARWTCNTKYRSLGMVSSNREDKIKFIKNGLSKEPLDSIISALEMHSSGHVQHELQRLWIKFMNEHQQYSLGNLTEKDPVCQLIRKLHGKQILNS